MSWRMAFPTLIPAAVSSWNLWGGDSTRAVTDRDPDGLYAPDNICTKTGLRVLDVLRKKRPDARIPEERAFDFYANSAELLEVMPIACHEEQISIRAAHLSGGACHRPWYIGGKVSR